MDGLLPIWKPEGITSFDVIRIVKRDVLNKLPERVKIGHAGTLDPFAEGVLIIMLGKATRRFDEIQTWNKTYRAVARLGYSSDTLDSTGTIEESQGTSASVTIPVAMESAQKFTGTFEQAVPQYSAAKYKGRALYTYAREGIETPEKRKKVTVYSLDISRLDPQEAELVITCSSGTYIRQLSYDIFRSLGVDSYLTSLIRESVGGITRSDCLSLEQAALADTVQQTVRRYAGAS